MGKALIFLGIVVALISALADVIGIGDGYAFGRYQITGTVLGLVIAGIGWITKNAQIPTSARLRPAVQ